MVRMPSRAQVRMTRSAISPRLAMRTEPMGRGLKRSDTGKILHTIDGARAGDRRLHRADRETESEHVARVGGIDQAVVPESRRAVIGSGLFIEHLGQFLLMGREI